MDFTKWKELGNSLMDNPCKVLRYFIFSLDHSDKGASIKKLLAWVFACCIVFLHWCLYKYQLAAVRPDFGLYIKVLTLDIIVLGGLIGVNFLQERHLKNLQADADKDDSAPDETKGTP